MRGFRGSRLRTRGAVKRWHCPATNRRTITCSLGSDVIAARRYSHHESKGYQSMGSFHSDNLGVLMSLSDKDYQPPGLPFPERTRRPSTSTDHTTDFLLDRKGFTFLNHGAFGAALTVGYQRAEEWRYYLERQPLRYFDRDLLPHLAYATRRLASFCSPASSSSHGCTTLETRESLTLIQNATAGLNSVIRGYKREYGNDANILLWDTSYGSLKKLAAHVCGSEHVFEIPLQSKYLSQFGKNTDDPNQVFLQALEDTIQQQHLLRLGKNNDDNRHFLLVLDHVTSNTAINMPIETISKWIKEKYGDKVLVLVDGAHGLLAHDINLGSYKTNAGIDFYIANGHKWLSCPRGVGMLYCPEEHLRNTILAEPAVISHGVDEPDFLSRFVWDGTRDYAAALALPAVLDYWEARQPHQVRTTLREKLLAGIQILSNHWHLGSTEWLDNRVLLVPPSLISPMALVRLPNTISGSGLDDPKTSADGKRVQDFLYDNGIEVPIKCVNGELYARVSCHVYNELEEFERLGKVLLKFPVV